MINKSSENNKIICLNLASEIWACFTYLFFTVIEAYYHDIMPLKLSRPINFKIIIILTWHSYTMNYSKVIPNEFQYHLFSHPQEQ